MARWEDPNIKITTPTKATSDLLNAEKQMIRAIEEYLHDEYMIE